MKQLVFEGWGYGNEIEHIVGMYIECFGIINFIFLKYWIALCIRKHQFDGNRMGFFMENGSFTEKIRRFHQ